MFHKIKSVKAAESYCLLVEFETGEYRVYDVKNMAQQFPVFQLLFSESELFSQVKVDQGGYGISWNDELDISCNELWEHGIEA